MIVLVLMHYVPLQQDYVITKRINSDLDMFCSSASSVVVADVDNGEDGDGEMDDELFTFFSVLMDVVRELSVEVSIRLQLLNSLFLRSSSIVVVKVLRSSINSFKAASSLIDFVFNNSFSIFAASNALCQRASSSFTDVCNLDSIDSVASNADL
uniref:Wsv293 n=1 Tax=Schistosoma curassoni TaxID=6186 RepID=A0A183JNH5_9TREM